MSTACGISLKIGSNVPCLKIAPNRLACCLFPACSGQRRFLTEKIDDDRLEGAVTTNLLVTSFDHREGSTLADMSCVRFYIDRQRIYIDASPKLNPPRGLAAKHFRRGEVGDRRRWNRRWTFADRANSSLQLMLFSNGRWKDHLEICRSRILIGSIE